jgi:hypothetical protein
MPYTIQIEMLGAAGPDAVTPLDLSNPAVTRIQDNDRIIVTIPDGVAFGNFDPGQIVGLLNVPYILLSLTMKSSLDPPVAGTGSVAGPQAPGAAFSTRKTVTVIAFGGGDITLAGFMLPRDHLLTFASADPGPFIIVATLEPVRNVGLVSSYITARG